MKNHFKRNDEREKIVLKNTNCYHNRSYRNSDFLYDDLLHKRGG